MLINEVLLLSLTIQNYLTNNESKVILNEITVKSQTNKKKHYICIENIFFNFRTRKWHCVQNFLVTLLSVRLTAVPWICCGNSLYFRADFMTENT